MGTQNERPVLDLITQFTEPPMATAAGGFPCLELQMDTISVPVNLVSLSAAISSRVEALTPDSPADDVLSIIRLTETLEGVLDRLALEFAPDSVSTAAT